MTQSVAKADKPTLFLSYARKDDEPFVRRLYGDLTHAGFDVWFDRVSLPARQLTFHQEIADAIRGRDRLIMVVGPQAALSDYVRQEWRWALELDKPVIPILRRGDYDAVPGELSLLHCDDFRDDGQYAVQLGKLIANLNLPEPPSGKLFAVPSLPAHFIGRPELMLKLKDAVLMDLRKPVVITGAAARVGVQGMGGIGKSVVAAALARNREVRRSYPDGIVWVSLGQQPNLVQLQRNVANILGSDEHFEDETEGRVVLQELLAQKAVFLVLDDVWEAKHAMAFDALGPRCRALLTTRNADILDTLHGMSLQVELFTEAEALQLLADSVDLAPHDLPPEAAGIIKECGCLPLAVALCGGMARRGTRWASILERLRRADLDKIADRESINEQHRSIWRAMQASVEMLSDDEQRRFAELAVFATDQTVPEAAAASLWSHTGGLDDLDAEDVLIDLGQRSLIRLDKVTGPDGQVQRRLSLHDLLYDYAASTAGDLKALHQSLLDAYWKRCPAGWHSGPNDGYFFGHLCYHLHAAGHERSLEQLLMQFPWLAARLETSGVVALLGDYENLRLPEESELGVVLSALRMAAPFTHRAGDLAGQIYGHLLTHRSPGIQHFLAGMAVGGPWLRPVNLALRQAGAPSLGIYRPRSGQIAALTVLPDGSRVMAASINKTITLLDLESGDEISTFRDAQAPAVVKEYAHPKARSRLGEEGPHSRPISSLPSIIITPNTHFIVCTFDDKTARVWKSDNLDFTFGIDAITAVTASADGRFLITAEDTQLTLRDCVSGQIIQTLADVGKDISSIAAMADGERAIIVSLEGHDHCLKICNFKTGKVERVLPCGHSDGARWESWSSYDTYYDVGGRYIIEADGAINAIALTPDDRYVVSASRDGTLKVWDLRTDEIIHTLRGHSGSVNAVAIIPDTTYAVSASSDKTLKIWNIGNGQLMRTFTGHSDEIYSLAVTPDGRRAVSAEKELLFVWDLRSSEEERSFVSFQKEVIKCLRSIWSSRDVYYRKEVPDDIKSVTLRSDGKQLVLVNKLLKRDDRNYQRNNHENYVYAGDQFMGCELLSGAITRHPGKRYKTLNVIAVTPDGHYITSVDAGNTLRFSKIDMENETFTFSGYSSDVNAVAVTPDGQFVIFGFSDGTLKLLDLNRRTEVRTFRGHKSPVTAVTTTPDGKHAISAAADNELKLWDLNSGEEMYTFRGHSGDVTSIGVTPDGSHAISASADATLKLWSLEKREELFTLRDHSGPVNAVAVTPDGRQAISAGEDETIKVWDLRQRRVRQTLKGHLGPVTAVVVAPDGNHVISVGRALEGNFMLAWNIEPDDKTCNLMWHFDSVRAIAITGDGRYAVSAAEDTTLKVWDLEQRTALHVLQGHRGKVFGVAITPDGRFAVSGSGGYEDNSIKVWSLDSGKLITTLTGHEGIFGSVNAVAITPDGKRIVSASADDTLKVWDMESGVEMLALRGHSSYVNGVVVTPDGKRIVSASADTTLKVWNLEDGREIHTLRGHSSWVNAVAVTPDGKRVVSASADSTLKVWDLEDGRELCTLSGHSSYVNAVAVIPGSEYIVSASADKSLKVWRVESAEEVASFAAEAGLLCCAAVGGGTIMAGDEEGWLYVLQLVNEQS
jgi:WD40 repeat protein